jgi:5-formyltetrahydrofolate cyclo-ligase
VQAKAAFRSELLAGRAALSAAERAFAAAAIDASLGALVEAGTRVAAYVAIGNEPDTSALLARRPDVLLPVLLPDGDLDWATAGPLRPAAHGLLEPTGPRLGPAALATCDLVLVPALAVDRSGTRLGRGGGSYDRALPRARGLTVALLYDGETLEALPADQHDVRVQAVATPSYGLRRIPW